MNDSERAEHREMERDSVLDGTTGLSDLPLTDDLAKDIEPFTVREVFSPTKGFASDNIVGDSYKHMSIDTVARSKANHTKEQQTAICQFNIDKYSNREKGQNQDDIVKIRFYTDWLEELL